MKEFKKQKGILIFCGAVIFCFMMSFVRENLLEKKGKDSKEPLKKQIEQDLELFGQIKKARLIFSDKKASVLLSLQEGVLPSDNELLAICNHVSSGIQGLDFEQISISDIRGRVYKKQNTRAFLTDSLTYKLQRALEKVIPKEQFSLIIEENPTRIHLLFDERLRSEEKFLSYVTKEIETLDKQAITTLNWTHFPQLRNASKIYWALAIFFLIAFGGIYAIKMTSDQKKSGESKLAELIKQQPPKTLAIMLSYLEPKKAKKVLEALPTETQEAIENHFRGG